MDKTIMLFGDAKSFVGKLVKELAGARTGYKAALAKQEGGHTGLTVRDAHPQVLHRLIETDRRDTPLAPFVLII